MIKRKIPEYTPIKNVKFSIKGFGKIFDDKYLQKLVIIRIDEWIIIDNKKQQNLFKLYRPIQFPIKKQW